MGLMQNRIVVVTGASRGAGKGIALALGATGDTVPSYRRAFGDETTFSDAVVE